ncbi:ATP synthase F1 subunit gamma [Aciditerrimonas ferrireducens]|uniref:ATP synthase gamma chain n=1 Tax=Aciditerrimonas ferrireducens TaxID=667306 RepID=A0ABV6C2K9_9ACTN|nr:ATP synthase F1 subunit gamma [Aciditerrimonas ferrireducens]MCK4176336.1 ATP synthase F1 subunit gamma [Aciditerrimonas ferrireducens]
MPGGQERALRRRIRSVQATQKITRAMELIAASQIVRAQNRLAAALPYQRGLAEVLAEAAADAGDQAGRLLGTPEDPRRILVLCLVADRGLCGGYNANVLRATERLVRARRQAGATVQVVTVGRKAPPYLRFRRVEVSRSFGGFSDRPSFADARAVAEAVVPPFLAEEIDQVLVVSTRYRSAGTQVVEERQLLPLPDPSADGEATPRTPAAGEDLPPGTVGPEDRQGYVEFEPASQDLLGELVPRYAEAAIFGALLEAAVSEHTARQRAMAAATDNAEELVKTLTRVMNRARQDAITTEIMEIVGGAEALRQAEEAEAS